MNWLEVSLTVNGELAEAVADVFARFAPNGVTTEQAVVYTDDEDIGTPIGSITVRAYLPVNEKLEDTRSKLEESLYYLGTIKTLPEPVFTHIADKNWMEAWKEHYHPIPIGEKLMILPLWLESPEPARKSICIDPGMAFGTGTHPSTQLCLELIESYLNKIPIPERRKLSMIDIGCGSGILSIGALKLDTGFVLGVDIEEASVKASRENANSNNIKPKDFEIGLGSVSEIISGTFSIDHAPIVVANILAPIIIRLFEAGLADLVEPGGVLILSGILSEQADSVEDAARIHGFSHFERRFMEDWVAIICFN
jgi:ribosomal protein L11 methyltransferase